MSTSIDPTSAPSLAPVDRWFREECEHRTLLAEETLWREAFSRYEAGLRAGSPTDGSPAWPVLVSRLVFESPKMPRNQKEAVAAALGLLTGESGPSFPELARRLDAIADEFGVERSKVRGLLGPGLGFPWMFPRSLWTADVIGLAVGAMLASFAWKPGSEPDGTWFREEALGKKAYEVLASLARRAPEGSDLERVLAAMTSSVRLAEDEGRDFATTESGAFVSGLQLHGLTTGDLARLRPQLLALREAVVLVQSFNLYHYAERCLSQAGSLRPVDGAAAIAWLRRAANLYKRLSVAQLYPERVLERHQQICRDIEEVRREDGVDDPRSPHVLLVGTANSPADLQRLLLSVNHELIGFAYAKPVHVIVNDGSTGDARTQNELIIDSAARAGLSISHWTAERKEQFFDQLNAEIFPDGRFDVRDLAGPRKPGEKGVPYGRFRNLLRLVALKEVRDLGLDDPVLTWMDHDNAIGALVLTRSGTLSKRHVFNYFDQKNDIFEDGQVKVGGGGYTNDALEGVERFWVAWGILGQAFDLAQRHAPDGSPVLPVETDITRFRPWDQPETLERLPREGEEVETLSDQFLLLLATLVGTFRGKYDNQVQIYHPWSFGYVLAEDESLVEETRPFAGMPGGNTSFRSETLASPIPFITAGGRGEDIFHLWQLEARYGTGSIYLTHTPALHTRNVRSGRSDLMGEIIDSYNGRIFREPPLIWSALNRLAKGDPNAATPTASLVVETEHRIGALRAEAHARIESVSAYAAALAPYLDESRDFWWLRMADTDPRYRAVLGELRAIVSRYGDVGRYHLQADEKLLSLADVKELAEQFVAAYPHWETVVRHLGGVQPAAGVTGEQMTEGRREGYGSPLRDERPAQRPAAARPDRPSPPALAEPAGDEPWLEVVSTARALFHRYELGQAESDLVLDWPARVDRLRSIYAHYAAYAGDLPEWVWTRLYRDALLVPHSEPYVAVSTMLTEEFLSLDERGRQGAVAELAQRFGVDVDVVAQAQDAISSTPVPA